MGAVMVDGDHNRQYRMNICTTEMRKIINNDVGCGNIRSKRSKVSRPSSHPPPVEESVLPPAHPSPNTKHRKWTLSIQSTSPRRRGPTQFFRFSNFTVDDTKNDTRRRRSRHFVSHHSFSSFVIGDHTV